MVRVEAWPSVPASTKASEIPGGAGRGRLEEKS